MTDEKTQQSPPPMNDREVRKRVLAAAVNRCPPESLEAFYSAMVETINRFAQGQGLNAAGVAHGLVSAAMGVLEASNDADPHDTVQAFADLCQDARNAEARAEAETQTQSTGGESLH